MCCTVRSQFQLDENKILKFLTSNQLEGSDCSSCGLDSNFCIVPSYVGRALMQTYWTLVNVQPSQCSPLFHSIMSSPFPGLWQHPSCSICPHAPGYLQRGHCPVWIQRLQFSSQTAGKVLPFGGLWQTCFINKWDMNHWWRNFLFWLMHWAGQRETIFKVGENAAWEAAANPAQFSQYHGGFISFKYVLSANVCSDWVHPKLQSPESSKPAELCDVSCDECTALCSECGSSKLQQERSTHWGGCSYYGCLAVRAEPHPAATEESGILPRHHAGKEIES